MPKKEHGKAYDFSYYLQIVKDILIPFVIYYLLYLFAYIVVTTLVNGAVRNTNAVVNGFFLENQATVNAVIGGLAMLAGSIPLILGFRRTGRSIPVKKGAKQEFGTILITLVLAITSSLAVNILFIQLHLTEHSESYSRTADNQYSVIFPVGLFLYGIVSPFVEEIVFRGMVYNRCKKYFRAPVAIILSALLFGLYHGNFVQAVYGFFMGMLIAYIYEVFGKFLYAFLFHAAANAAVYTVTGNQILYEKIVTPYAGVVFCCICMVLLVFVRNRYCS